MTIAAFEVKYCPDCHGERPFSKRGKCQSCWTRRAKPMRRSRLHYAKPADELARWHAVKAQVFERDDFRCQRCNLTGRAAVLDAHHRIPRGHGCGVSDELVYGLANLITCCRFGCHLFVEQHRQEAMDQGWLITRFGDVDPASVPILTVRGWELLAGDGTRRGVEP